MAFDKTKILQALSRVIEPKSGQNIVAAKKVEDLKIADKNVSFSLVLSNVDATTKSDLNFACISHIQAVYPNAQVHVHLKNQTAHSQQANSSVPHIKNIIAIASGKGGVGKSTIATNLALGLKKLGVKVGLIDADLYGPSIPTMFGLKGQRPKIQNVYGKARIVPLEAYGLPLMSIGFIIEPEQAVVLRGPRLAAIIKQFFNDVLWPELDYLIVDLPPGTGDIQLTLVQTVPVTGAVLVTTPQEVAVADAIKAMNMFLLPSVNVPILGVIENMAWFTPKELPNNKYYLFGKNGGKKLVKMSQSMLLGQIPIVQGIREAGDEGHPIVLKNGLSSQAFMEVAKHVIRQIELRNTYLAPTKIVGVSN